MLKITGTAALGDLRSKLYMAEGEAHRVFEIPLDIVAADQAYEVLEALHVGELADALFDPKGGLRMPFFSTQAVDYPLRNIRMEIGYASGGQPLVIPSLDLHKLRWNVLSGFGVHLTCKAKATVTAEQLVGLWNLQPYTGLTCSLAENQTALSLEAA